jgi:hypothetical protein
MDALSTNAWAGMTKDITKAELLTKEEAKERIYRLPRSGEMYIRITVLIDK